MNEMAERMHYPAVPLVRPGGETDPVIPDSLMSAHYIQGKGYYVRRPHGSNTWLIFFTVRGFGYFISPQGRVETAWPGNIHLYPPGLYQEYGAVPPRGWDFHWAHFIPRPTWAPFLALPEVKEVPELRRAKIESAVTRKRIIGSFEEIHRDTVMSGGPRIELAFNSLERILLLVTEAVSGNSGRGAEPRVQKVLEAVAAAPSAKYTMEGLAKSVDLSPSRLAHLFKRVTGESVMDMIVNTRLKESSKLLRIGYRSVQEVAEMAGFNSPFYFSRRFARKYGLSPSVYRARFQQGRRESIRSGAVSYAGKRLVRAG